MVHDTNLQFIRENISELRNAMMYVTGNGLVKLGNDIVTALRVDDEGQLWFITNRPTHIEECEQSFPARLLFYKKGAPFFVEVSGKATIVNTTYFPSKPVKGQRSSKVLVKLAMTNIEYTEPHAKKPKRKIEVLVENCYDWFLRTISVPHNSDSVLKRLRQTN